MTRVELIRELVEVRGKIDAVEGPLDALRARRDELILELRSLDDRPSTRTLAELAGVSGPRITQIEGKAR